MGQFEYQPARFQPVLGSQRRRRRLGEQSGTYILVNTRSAKQYCDPSYAPYSQGSSLQTDPEKNPAKHRYQRWATTR